MALTTGTRLGAYEIVSALGAGGMGEVYRARDSRLHRDVAVKVLPDSVANDHEGLARFEREARLLASVNHPNIAHVYGLGGGHGAPSFIVMELVDGPTLADRIARGRLSIDEVLKIATQIAEALEAAHEHGIIHRDLKPANIKVRVDGTVKVLDFGLAKAMTPANNGVNIADSPTITSPVSMTADGVIIGTAPYMSPEQARGMDVDKRTDIWAFGCVLFEMLSGRRAFAGDGVSDVVASILRDEPDWSALPSDTPPEILKLTRRCLRKGRRERIADIVDAKFEIIDSTATPLTASPNQRNSRWWLAAAGVGAIGIVVGASMYRDNTSEVRAASAAPIRFSVSLPDGTFLDGAHPAFAISPDARTIVAAVVESDRNQRGQRLEVHRLDGTGFEPLRGAERGSRPFYFDEGRQVGFFDYVTGDLKAVDSGGGTPRLLCRLESSRLAGVSDGPDSSILVAHPRRGDRPALFRVPYSGGEPQLIVEPDVTRHEIEFAWPQLLPDGEHVLLTVGYDAPTPRHSIEALSLRTLERTVIVAEGIEARYVDPGYLVYFGSAGVGGTLVGDVVIAPFDAATRKPTGPAKPFVKGLQVTQFARVPGVDFAVSRDSFVTLGSRTVGFSRGSLAWVDRRGVVTQLAADVRPYRHPDLSRDGRFITFGVDGGNRDVWIYDVARDLPSRFTTADPDEDETPRWSPDGKRIAWAGSRDGERYLLMAPADGIVQEERLLSFDLRHMHVNGWSSDGGLLYLNVRDPKTGEDIWTYSFSDRVAKPFLATQADEFGAEPSPDGAWVAYASSVSGAVQVYLKRADGKGNLQISRDGGFGPRWSNDGLELFFRSADGRQLLAVPFSSHSASPVGAANTVLTVPFDLGPSPSRDPEYAVSPDGKRFLIMTPASPAVSPKLDVVVNWTSEIDGRSVRH
jgi:serine/threonine protein kinase